MGSRTSADIFPFFRFSLIHPSVLRWDIIFAMSLAQLTHEMRETTFPSRITPRTLRLETQGWRFERTVLHRSGIVLRSGIVPRLSGSMLPLHLRTRENRPRLACVDVM